MSMQSPFVRLPAELRNEIYELALSSPKPLTLARKYDGRAAMLLSEIHGVTREFNQLKYVNKQVYTETKYLELKYNDIVVTRTKLQDDPPAAQFLSWVYGMSLATSSWLDCATIVLRDSSIAARLSRTTHVPDTARTMSYLASFCNAHTAVTIHYHLPQLSFARPERHGTIVGTLHTGVVRSEIATCFFIPALIAEDIRLGLSFPINTELVAAQALAAKNWRAVDGVVELEQLQAQNIHYLPCTVDDMEEIRKRVNYRWGRGSHAADVIMRWAEHGLKASLDMIRSE